MTAENEEYFDCSFVSIHYIICECGKTFPSENGLRAHLEKEHPHKRERKEFKCGVCGSIFSTEDSCVSHYEAEHFADNDIKLEEEEVQEAPDLLEESGPEQEIEIIYHVEDPGDQQYEQEYQEALADHQDYEELQESVSQEVMQDSSSQDGVKRELVSQPTSQEAASRAETAQATQILVKANGNKQYPQVRAPPLKMVRDADSGQLVLVFNRARPHKKTSKPTDKLKVVKEIVCEVCGRKYASNAALKYHQRVHTGEKPYHCHMCPKAFTMPLFLQIHVRTHTGERPFQCPQCPKAFSNKAALLRHERVHTGEKPYACPMCFKAFTQSNSMKLHVATVHLKQPAPYKSRKRRLKEAARGLKQEPSNKIKAFAPSGESAAHHDDATQSDGEFEVVISEEVQEDQDDMCYEVVYETED